MNRIRLALALLIGALLAFLFSVPRANAQAPVMVEHVIVVPDTAARNVISEYETPVVYEQWWREIAACEGLELPLDHYRVRFFAIRAPHFYDRNHPSLYYAADGTLMVHWQEVTRNKTDRERSAHRDRLAQRRALPIT